jgi:SAM-dependent methyltransferase
VDREYGEVYRELFEKHWWWRSRTELIIDSLRKMNRGGKKERILDIGCGDGLFFDRLAEFGEVEGVEPSAELVRPDNPYRERIYVGPFDENFRPDKKYSLILMLDVLEHLEDAVGALRHALDLLSEDGLVIVTVPAFMTLWTNHDVLNHHLTRYTKRSFHAAARHAGLSIRKENYLYHWTCPVKLGVGIMERIVKAQPAAPEVPMSLVNNCLFWLSRLEQKTLSALPMPFGSSLMVVGGKRMLA